MTLSSHNTTFYTMKRVAISLILFLLAHLGVRVAGVQLSGYFDWGFVNISNRASVTRSNYNGGISLAYLFQ